MNYRNANYISNGRIDCEIEHPVHGWVPYTVDPADTDMTINNDALLAAMTLADDVAAYIPPTQEELAALLANEERHARNKRLRSEVDPIANNALRWAELTANAQAALGVYRKELLDVPQQAGFPKTHTWPNKP